jgi:hypothetical protein
MLWLIWVRRDRAGIIIVMVVIEICIIEIICTCSFVDECINLVCMGDIRRADTISGGLHSLDKLKRAQ